MKLGLAALFWVVAAATFAEEQAPARARDVDSIADQIDLEETETYVEKVNCIALHRIKRTRAVGNQSMLFFMRDGTVFLNQFTHRCPRMGPPQLTSFESRSNGRFCRLDRLIVLDSALHEIGSCNIGSFEEVSEEQSELILSEPTRGGKDVREAVEDE